MTLNIWFSYMLYISADLGSHKNIVQAKWIVNSKSLRKPDLEGLCCTCVYMQSSIYSPDWQNQNIGQLRQTLGMCCALKYQIFSQGKVLFISKINVSLICVQICYLPLIAGKIIYIPGNQIPHYVFSVYLIYQDSH